MTAEDDLRAGEYALGLLNAEEAEAVGRDRALLSRAGWWREQLVPLVDSVAVAPPPQLWSRIERRLASNDNSASGTNRFWKGATFAVSALAASLLAFIALRPEPAPQIVTREGPPLVVTREIPVDRSKDEPRGQGPTVTRRNGDTQLAEREPVPPPIVTRAAPAPMVALLSGKGGTQVAVSFARDSSRLRVTPTLLRVRRGDAQLWVIPADGKPRSLGVVSATASVSVNVPVLLHPYLAPGATLAVSLEPPGGSPTGAPTGPVVATGKLFEA